MNNTYYEDTRFREECLRTGITNAVDNGNFDSEYFSDHRLQELYKAFLYAKVDLEDYLGMLKIKGIN